jgi:hypothetical protein
MRRVILLKMKMFNIILEVGAVLSSSNRSSKWSELASFCTDKSQMFVSSSSIHWFLVSKYTNGIKCITLQTYIMHSRFQEVHILHSN